MGFDSDSSNVSDYPLQGTTGGGEGGPHRQRGVRSLTRRKDPTTLPKREDTSVCERENSDLDSNKSLSVSSPN